MPPFGARGTASQPVPPADLRRHRRDLWCRVVFVATVTIIGAGAGLFMRSAEQVLDRRGVETEAVVVETNRVRRLPDEAVVQYRVEGLLRQATLTVSSAGDFEIGQRIAIVYDPDDPVHARPLEGWSPTYRTLWRYAAIAGPFALILSLTVPRRLRADTAAAGSGAVHHMYGASYRRSLWLVLHLRATHIVGLWPEGADRDAPAPLSVEVDRGLGPSRPGLVVVVGRAEPGHHVVLSIEGETVWTKSTVRAGIDPQAKPLRPKKLPWPLRPSA